jgi:hypothetical protein
MASLSNQVEEIYLASPILVGNPPRHRRVNFGGQATPTAGKPPRNKMDFRSFDDAQDKVRGNDPSSSLRDFAGQAKKNPPTATPDKNIRGQAGWVGPLLQDQGVWVPADVVRGSTLRYEGLNILFGILRTGFIGIIK